VWPDGVGLEHHRQAALLGADIDAVLRRIDRDAVDANFARGRLLEAVSCSPGSTLKLTPRTAGTLP
jgi:hypothetical protein